MGKKIISMSLWGDTPMYTVGAIRNAEMNPKIFGPDWISRFYIGKDVPNPIVERLMSLPQTECIPLPHEDPDWNGMFWRFWAISDEDADVVIFRDTDSRPSVRDSAAVQEWLDSGKLLHLMRDHPYHTEPIMGGMWGCRAKETYEKLKSELSQLQFSNMEELTKKWWEHQKEKSYRVHVLREGGDFWTKRYAPYDMMTGKSKKGVDQLFLRMVVYKAFQQEFFIQDAFPMYNSFSGVFDEQRYFQSDAGTGVKKEITTGFPSMRQTWNDTFPSKWHDFIGQQWDEFDVPNEEYAQLLKQRDECIYSDWKKKD